MPGTSSLQYSRCHLGYIQRPGSNGRSQATAVWICEYPYRTTRVQGPSSECGECPVWRDMQCNRRGTDHRDVDDIERLEHQLTA